MLSEEILREEWPAFFNKFNREHRGGIITLEEFDSRSGAYIVTWDLAFEGIAANLQRRDQEAVTIMVSENSNRRITYLIVSPSSIKLKKTGEGKQNTLQIKAANGLTTSVHFPVVRLPEEVFWSLLASAGKLPTGRGLTKNGPELMKKSAN